MKTTPTAFNINHRHAADVRTRRDARSFPKTDSNYHATSLPGGCGAAAICRAKSFRDISRDYFAHEAPRSFVTEAALFALIIVTAALPLLNSANALADFVKTVGVL